MTAIKPFLPYKSRLKALTQLSGELQALALTAEDDWLEVARLTISDEEIHRRTIALKRKALAAQTKSFGGASLPPNVKWEQAGDQEAKDYMLSYVAEEA